MGELAFKRGQSSKKALGLGLRPVVSIEENSTQTPLSYEKIQHLISFKEYADLWSVAVYPIFLIPRNMDLDAINREFVSKMTPDFSIIGELIGGLKPQYRSVEFGVDFHVIKADDEYKGIMLNDLNYIWVDLYGESRWIDWVDHRLELNPF